MPSDYQRKKQFFDDMITLYGRKPVLEALHDEDIEIYRLHLTRGESAAEPVAQMAQLARDRKVEVVRHSREELARISRNGRQDQGVAVDIRAPNYRSVQDLPDASTELVALEGVTNPQNLGLIIRSIAAAPNHALLLPRKGCAGLDPLVHKASAGTLFKTTIFHCDTTLAALTTARKHGYRIAGLAADGDVSIAELQDDRPRCFVLGGEATGLSDETLRSCDERVHIPMRTGIDSLNTAVAAAIVCFRGVVGAGI